MKSLNITNVKNYYEVKIMSVSKRGSYWEYRFYTAVVNGKRKRLSKSGFRTKKEAEAAEAKAKNQYNNAGVIFKPSEISVADYYDLWIEKYCKINCKPTTIEGYEKRIKNLIKTAIGNYKLRALQPAAIQQFINDLFNSGYSRNTLTSIKGLLTGALDYAVEPLQYIPYNPAKVIRLPSKRAIPKIPSRKKEKIPITDEQMETILSRFPEGHSAHIPLQLAWRVGLREGEVFALQWNDIDFQAGTLTVHNQVQMINKVWTLVQPKYDSVRTVKIDSELLALLDRTKAQQEKNRNEYAEYYQRLWLTDKNQISKEHTNREAFFINVRENGTYIQPRILAHVGRIIHYEIGYKDYDYHTLRHTHSTKLYENGATLIDIKARLGHCDEKTTIRYTHDSDKQREYTDAIVEKIFAANSVVKN